MTAKIKSGGGSAEFVLLDVSREEDCQRVAENVLAAREIADDPEANREGEKQPGLLEPS